MKRLDFRFLHRLRVRWAEVDMQKIVFNAHYLMYFDTAISDYWRVLALPYDEAMQRLGGDLYVKKATVEFHASARMDDQLEVGLRCARIGNSSLQFIGGIFRGEQLLISSELIYVYADPATQTSRPVPAELRQLLTDFEAGSEAGAALTTLRVGGWAELGEAASRVRTEVFVREQRIPAEMEWDVADQTAVHAVVFNRLGMPLATGRLLRDEEPGVGKLGRMAVHRALRGTRLGRDIVSALTQAAQQRGDRALVLHAQRSAEGFYARLGFEVRGEPYEEVGIPHVTMVRSLSH
ncbi:YbgC/FadM family acyl-CoA thioesterase [Hylemonella gracilis]|uniref:4-hydroxybenzoyl-CoA thioesterase n=1 Tax=Hylemonella gracilis ATCC 19624 TaxID=887062 RepID=F3KNX7_9BURK|nr:YbgC/FadM family acyl-CoA thioesterase [Hylemonella gracilis]EGI78554.1 4-hydroxybenzoyl-CoA thioesterase [Hylemonella gracilis ATCC 19624]